MPNTSHCWSWPTKSTTPNWPWVKVNWSISCKSIRISARKTREWNSACVVSNVTKDSPKGYAGWLNNLYNLIDFIRLWRECFRLLIDQSRIIWNKDSVIASIAHPHCRCQRQSAFEFNCSLTLVFQIWSVFTSETLFIGDLASLSVYLSSQVFHCFLFRVHRRRRRHVRRLRREEAKEQNEEIKE